MHTILSRMIILNSFFFLGLGEVRFANKISVGLADRATLIQDLYSKAWIAPAAYNNPNIRDVELSYLEASSLVGKEIDYLYGRAMKVMVPSASEGDVLVTSGYDEVNGVGAAERIVAKNRFGGMELHEAVVQAQNETGQTLLQDGTLIPSKLNAIAFAQIRQLMVPSDRDSMNMLKHLYQKARLGREYNINGNYRSRMKQEGLLDSTGEVPSYLRQALLSMDNENLKKIIVKKHCDTALGQM